MGRLFVPSTPATRGEVSVEEEQRGLSVEDLRKQADALGFDVVERVEAEKAESDDKPEDKPEKPVSTVVEEPAQAPTTTPANRRGGASK